MEATSAAARDWGSGNRIGRRRSALIQWMVQVLQWHPIQATTAEIGWPKLPLWMLGGRRREQATATAIGMVDLFVGVVMAVVVLDVVANGQGALCVRVKEELSLTLKIFPTRGISMMKMRGEVENRILMQVQRTLPEVEKPLYLSVDFPALKLVFAQRGGVRR